MPPGAMAQLKSILLATFVAALIWIYAEGESLTTRTIGVNLSLPLDPAASLVVRPLDPAWTGTARVRLEGNTRTIDEAASVLGGGVGIALTPGSPGVPNAPGPEATIDLREAISAIPALKGLGSSVADVEPRHVRVSVHRLESRELPVRVELGIEIPLDGEPVAQPATATIRAPAGAIGSLSDGDGGGGGAAIIATVAGDDLRRLTGDRTETVTAALRPPPGLSSNLPVTITPETVAVQLRIRRKVETIRVPTIPVWFSLPPTEDGGKWNVELLDKFLTDFSLTGVSDDVQRVRSGALVPKALVELTTEDLERGLTSKMVVFPGLPASLAPTFSSPNVRFKITRQQGPAAPGR